ncbi:MAG: PKD domain-containing protein [Candidatus Bipolaricaulia bacterium]
MKRLVFGPVFAVAALAVFAVCGLAWDADYDPSTFNPGVDEPVTFAVCEPCMDSGSYRYAWDFDGDGTTDLESDDPVVEYAFAESGFFEAELTLTDADGRRKTKRKGILVGTYPAFAVRETVDQGDGTIFVLITVTVTETLSAPGIQEGMPRGWQFELLDSGGAYTRPNDEERIYEVIWWNEAEAGTELTFSYRLHPGTSYLTELSGEFSGVLDGRFVGEICGEIEIES